MPNTNLKAIIVTIAENKSHYYEYNKGQILHNSDIDNQGLKADHSFAGAAGEVKISGNEDNYKSEMNKDHLEQAFSHLKTLLLPESKLHDTTNILIFFSSNTAKHDLEKAISDFKDQHHKVNIDIIAKNLNDHNHIEAAAKAHYEA